MQGRLLSASHIIDLRLVCTINRLEIIMRHTISGIIMLAALLLTGCGGTNSSSGNANDTAASRDIFAMDTFMSLKAYGSNADEALDKAGERIRVLEEELSVTNENSDIWRIDHAGGNPVQVSEDTAAILKKALEISDDTDGALNVCLYPVVSAWGFTTGEYRIPDDKEISSLLKNTDWYSLHLDGSTVTLPEKYQIDTGALAKGYTSDEVMEIMRESGVDSAIVSLGGNVQALGTKPDGSLWKVAVRDPFSPDTDMCVIEVGEKAVITSGNYERYFTGEDGNNYWHIIDGNDGYPADNGAVSVTVIGSSGIECDALSTALFVMGYPAACDYWRSRQDFDMVIVTDDQRIYYTEGIADVFSNISSMPAEVIPVA